MLTNIFLNVMANLSFSNAYFFKNCFFGSTIMMKAIYSGTFVDHYSLGTRQSKDGGAGETLFMRKGRFHAKAKSGLSVY